MGQIEEIIRETLDKDKKTSINTKYIQVYNTLNSYIEKYENINIKRFFNKKTVNSHQNF